MELGIATSGILLTNTLRFKLCGLGARYSADRNAVHKGKDIEGESCPRLPLPLNVRLGAVSSVGRAAAF